MKAICNIAAGFFGFLPFQRWCNVIGAVLMTAGIALTLMAANPKAAVSMTGLFALPGVFLILVAPLAFGGLALRYVSARTTLHLRPHGRVRILLGSTLAITLLAVVVSLPTLALHHVFVKAGATHNMAALAQPVEWFLGAWGLLAIAWLGMFIAGSSRMLMLMVGPFPLVMMVAAKALHLSAPDLRIVVSLIAAACAAFALWYMRVSRIRSPDWIGGQWSMDFGISPGGSASRPQALRQYLLGPVSSPQYILAGAIPAVFAVVMTMMLPQDRFQVNPGSFLLMLTIAPASLGYLMARRARYLWLRIGLRRAALFRLAERTGMQTALLIVVIGTGILLTAGTLLKPQPVSMSLLSLLVVILLSFSVFYYGLSLTRGWSAESVILAIGLTLLAGISGSFIDPAHHPTATTLWRVAGLFALLIAPLRWYASRRWLTLDWRVAKLPRMGRQAS